MLPAIPNLASIATQLLSMHTIACASGRKWPKWGLILTKNGGGLGIVHASQMNFLSEDHVLTEFSEAELLDLLLEDDGHDAS